MSQSLGLSGKVVIVTGGTQGIGLGIVRAFQGEGARLVVCARKPPGDGVLPEGVHFVAADVREPDQIDRVVGAARERFGRLDVLVNNAGGSPWAEAATASPRFLEKIIALNLTAPFVFAQRANAVMQQQPEGGCIVNIASVSGTRPSPGTAAYGAAKAGLLNLTETLAIEWAPRVRVNAVTVGLVRTEQSHLHYGDDAGVARVAATVPLGRLAEPSEVGAACLYLASDLASYVTGAALRVHGGGESPAFLAAARGA